jgi:membrane-associated phospholipid phosphatase
MLTSTVKKAARPVTILAVLLLGSAGTAVAEPESPSRCDTVSSKDLVAGPVRGLRQLPSAGSLGIVAVGGLAALGAHTVDHALSRSLSDARQLNDSFKSGAIVGGTPFELGAAFLTYGMGRALQKPCVARLGADLVQVQVMSEALVFALKEATRRRRPDGSDFSFPSGHTTTAFASATVLQQHFGWKVGVPAYAVATYVAASRVQMKRHYLSDVAFGAALGIAAGRTITVWDKRLTLTPTAAPGGAGLAFTWSGKQPPAAPLRP